MKGNIGVFDSGIGGVTVLKEIIKILPNENFIFFSDSKNNPYGEKNQKQIIEYSEYIVEYLIKENCKIIIIACNTASAIAAEYLRKKYKTIPILAIEPAYKMVYDYAYNETALVMATKGTIESEKFNLLYNKYNNNKTILLPCSGLAELIEKGENEKIIKYLQENLGKYKGKVKNVVLGCTHYPLIIDEIKRVLGDVKFFDGAPKLAQHLKNKIENNEKSNNEKRIIKFVDSQNSKEKEERFFRILNSI